MAVWVGLSGGIGSGKSSAARLFSERHGVPVIDADAIARSLTADQGAALPAIRAAFGDELFDVSGSLLRQHLRDKVFADPAARGVLESILHPLIQREIEAQQARWQDEVYGVVEIPLLAEQPQFQDLVDRVLIIDCPESLQIRRVAERSGLSHDMIRQILSAQATRAQRLALADDVIENSGPPAALAAAVAKQHAHYRQLFGG
ncbi:dephospho-CoA kinase [Neisseria shayeganii]|uniref:Dephospho-CoA kinase n=1 Tax=Neisseria shayeganii 871 TaxID=1032488 RepID=G4CKC6_9NEIS|nr:dephospho-CoA kinase [Neisseria shayeganii]EGY51717.1 dephospho-CoA kinase [Neisseria shayeganii 871]